MIEIQHFLASILIALLGFIGVTPSQEPTLGATPALTVPAGGTGWGNIQGGTLIYGTGNSLRVGTTSTTTLTTSGALSFSQPVTILGSASSALTLDTSGSWTGNAGTATALAGNGANCSSGLAPLGVDASGAVESCFDVWTEAENTSAGYVQNTRTLTVAGTANQVSSSAGAQDLSANRTWTLSLPDHVIFPNSFFASLASTTNATTTTFAITGLSKGGLSIGDGGKLYSSATTTAGTGLTFTGTAFNVNTSQNITTLSNLTGNGLVYTSGGTGTLNTANFSANTVPYVNGAGTGINYVATSSLYDGSNGQVLAKVGNIWIGVATTTAGTGLTYTGSAFNVNTSQNITTLSNLTSDGVVYTSGANGTLNVDSGALDVARGGTGATSLNDLITLATHTVGNFVATITGTANQISVSGSGSENAGVTLSLPAHIIGTAMNFGFSSTTHATSTNHDITGKLTFGGVTGTTWSAFCTSITGGAGLCDGSDDGGAGGSAFEIATTSDIGVSQVPYITKTTGRTTIASVATTTLVAGTNISFSGGTPVVLGSSPVTINSTASGGSGNMSGWATTTTAGLTLLYPVNASTTDVLFGTSATTTAPFWWDVSATTTYIGTGGAGSSTSQYGRQGFEWLMGYDGSDNAFKISSSTVDIGLAVNNVLSIAKTTLLTTFNYAVTFLGNIVASANVDFGGATFLEIPNGANPTANDVGEIAHDTTDNQLILDDFVVRTIPRIGGFKVSSTTEPFYSGFVSGQSIPFVIERDGYTVTEIWCDIDGGTSIVINFDNGTGNTETVTCDTDGASNTAIATNNVVTAGSVTPTIEFGTVTGTVDRLRVSIFGTYARE